MRKLFLIFTLALLCFLTVNSQDTLKIKYYKSKDDLTIYSKKSAKVKEYTIQEADGVLRYEMKDIETQKLLCLKRYKNKEPYGKWYFAAEFTDKPLEYEYNKNEYSGYIGFDLKANRPKGEADASFKNPKFPDPSISFLEFVALGIRYPLALKEKNIQGTVISQFIINTSGEISNISILKSVDPELDKEVVRVLAKSPKWIPAELNGKKIPVHIIFPTHFKIN